MRIHSIVTLTFKCICFIPGLSRSQRRCLAKGETWPHDKGKEENSCVLRTIAEP